MGLVLRALDADDGERAIPGGRPFFMGRGPDNDWVLDDPAREISKVHCRIDDDGQAHLLTDMSINGVHLEREGRLLGRGNRHRLAAGDVFAVGPHRFAVVESVEAPTHAVASSAETAQDGVGDIMGGHGDGEEARASAALTGESQGWLGALPLHSAAEGLAQPLGWSDPPATDGSILPDDVDQPRSHLADALEHVPATASALFVPKTTQFLPTDWFDENGGGDTAAFSSATARHPPAAAPPGDGGPSRRALAQGARIDEAAVSGVGDPALFARAGALVRALTDGLEALEAAQAAAEHDCGLVVGGEAALWTDFLSAARDPCVKLLADDDEALGELSRRFGALADRQRALGAALAEAAATWDRRLAPAAIADVAVPWFAAGPLGRATLWGRYADAHAALGRETAEPGGDDGHPLTGLVRRAFARRLSEA